MMPRRALAVLLFPALAALGAAGPGCGGGPSGTARSTIEGNVADVEHAMRRRDRVPGPVEIVLALVRPIASAWAQTGLEDIRVSIEGTPYETRTAPDGRFVLVSPYAGDATLLFERENDAFVGRLDVFVPEGATVTLHDVRCSLPLGSCEAEDIVVEEPVEPSATLEGPRSESSPPLGPSEPREPPFGRGPKGATDPARPDAGRADDRARPETGRSDRPADPDAPSSREGSRGGPPPGIHRAADRGVEGNGVGRPNQGPARSPSARPAEVRGRGNSANPPGQTGRGDGRDRSNGGRAGVSGLGAAR